MLSEQWSPDLLEDAIEGRLGGRMPQAVSAAVSLAARLGDLLPPGADGPATARMTAAFGERLTRPAPTVWLRALAPWAGAGPVPRPLVERMAAGAVVLGLLTSGGSMAATGDPLAFGKGAAEFTRSLVVNLDPRDGETGGGAPTPKPSPATTPEAAASPTPSATPDDEEDETEDEHEDEDDDHSSDDDGSTGR